MFHLYPNLVFQTFDLIIFGTLTFPGTRWYVLTVRDPQMVRDQKKFGNHWHRWCLRLESNARLYCSLMSARCVRDKHYLRIPFRKLPQVETFWICPWVEQSSPSRHVGCVALCFVQKFLVQLLVESKFKTVSSEFSYFVGCSRQLRINVKSDEPSSSRASMALHLPCSTVLRTSQADVTYRILMVSAWRHGSHGSHCID